MNKVTVDTGQIFVIAACLAFVRVMHPRHDIMEIEVGDYQPEEGYFPTITICPEDDPFGDERLQVPINVWVGSFPYIKYGEGEELELRWSGFGAEIRPFNKRCPECGKQDITFPIEDGPLPDLRMSCSDCGREGPFEDFEK